MDQQQKKGPQQNFRGERDKQPLGYIGRNGKLYTNSEALATFGVLLHFEPFPAMPIWEESRYYEELAKTYGAEVLGALR